MQIPFEVDPPKKNTNKDARTENLDPKENERLQFFNHEDSLIKDKKPLTVTQLTRQISVLLEDKFRSMFVVGEISNVKKATSGHWYFSLKDDQSQIRGVIFRNIANGLRFEPENGLEVILRGSISVYQQRGDYQIMVSSMEPKGLGALQLAFDQLKSKLEAEGLFDSKNKVQIPFLPRKIGIVTSATGAVIHDMLTVLKRRFQEIPVLFFPAPVQGDTAVDKLVEGVNYMNTLHDSESVDVLIVGRGGGSMEDLWAFNDEKLARSIFASRVPVISAIGHETDFTIADFVSDLRAPTPSAAIELAVPNKKDLKYTVKQKKERLQRTLFQMLERLRDNHTTVQCRLISPSSVLRQYAQHVDDLDSLLHDRTKSKLENLRLAISAINEKIFILSPSRELKIHKQKLEMLHDHLMRAIEKFCKNQSDSVRQSIDLLDSLSPLSVMCRGYSVVLDKEGKPIYSTKKTFLGEDLRVRMIDGTLQTKVISIITKQKN